jgi:hypothetical protein
MTKEEKKMFKEACSKLQAMAYATMNEIVCFIKGHTEEEPLILYDKENVDGTDDKFYELPFAYYVDKHSFYCEGRIVEVQGDNVLMLFTGEEFGDEHELELNQIPFESLVELLSYLEKRF